MTHPLFRLTLVALLIQTNHLAYAQNDIRQLDALVLQAQAPQHDKDLNQAIGAINTIDVDSKRQRMQSNADILQGEAGIYAQTAGNEGVKISIRGSGINRGSGAHASGTHVLLDGIAFTGPGGTPYELLEPNWLSDVNVFKGSQGFEYGALALGGAINYVTQTGQNQQGGRLSVVLGGHDYQKYHLSYGEDLGALDYFVAATYTESAGYQQHSQSEAKGVAANIGYQINDYIDNRFYLRYRETQHQTPGRLTQAQIQNNPEQANPYNVSIDAKRIQPGSTWIANQTTMQLDDGATLQANFAYHDYPMDLQESGYRVYVDYTDLTAQLSWTQPFEWLGRPNVTKMIFKSTTQHDSALGKESLRFSNDYSVTGDISRRYIHRGHDHLLNIQNEIEWYPDIWLMAGIGTNYIQRAAYVTFPQTQPKLTQADWDYVYRLGIRYDFDDSTQWYANVSRSIEPAHAWSMLWGSDQYFPIGSGASTGRQRAARPLDHQVANSLEIGGRGQGSLGEWNVNYYFMKIDNELLMLELQPTPNQIIAESNADHTIHQGVEIGLNSQIWQGLHGETINLKQAYTFNHFHYKDDITFKRNELAGIPRHYYQAQLQYQHPIGWFMGLNTEYADRMPIDYANSHYTDAYHVWGLQAGWNGILPNTDLWIELKNLSNEKYSSTITPGFNDAAQDRARATPGELRTFYAGLNYRF